MSNVYIIEAYKWGVMNEHHFVVNALCNKKEAIKYAKWYHEHRDNKYGLKISRYNSEGKVTVIQVIKYIPSKCGEEDIYFNDLKEDLTSLGQHILYLNEDSISKLPPIIRKEVKHIKKKKYE